MCDLITISETILASPDLILSLMSSPPRGCALSEFPQRRGGSRIMGATLSGLLMNGSHNIWHNLLMSWSHTCRAGVTLSSFFDGMGTFERSNDPRLNSMVMVINNEVFEMLQVMVQ